MDFDSLLNLDSVEFPTTLDELETPNGNIFEEKTMNTETTASTIDKMSVVEQLSTINGDDLGKSKESFGKGGGLFVPNATEIIKEPYDISKYQTQDNELGIIPKAVLNAWVGKMKEESQAKKMEQQQHYQQSNVFVDPVQLSSNSEVQALMRPNPHREGSPFEIQGTPSPGHYGELDDDDVPKLSKRGRKKKKDSPAAVSEEQKKARRREANRLSAAASRKRKKRYVQDLEVTIKSLSDQNSALITHLKQNQRETAMLKQMVEEMRTQQRQQQDYQMSQPIKKKMRMNNNESKNIFAENETIYTYNNDNELQTPVGEPTSWFEMTLPKTLLCVFIFCFVLAIGLYQPATHAKQDMANYHPNSAVLYNVPQPTQASTMKRHSRQILSVTCKKILAQQADSMRNLANQVQLFQDDLNQFLSTFESTDAASNHVNKEAADL